MEWKLESEHVCIILLENWWEIKLSLTCLKSAENKQWDRSICKDLLSFKTYFLCKETCVKALWRILLHRRAVSDKFHTREYDYMPLRPTKRKLTHCFHHLRSKCLDPLLVVFKHHSLPYDEIIINYAKTKSLAYQFSTHAN